MVTTGSFHYESETPVHNPSRWRPWISRSQIATALGLSILIAFGMSVQFLAQVFVWRNWPVTEVLEGWLYILRDRLVVAVLIVVGIGATSLAGARKLKLRSALLAAGVLAGALCGETVVRALNGDRESLSPLIAHALRWSAVALAVAASYHLWRASSEAREALRREQLKRQQVQQQLTTTRLTALRKQIEPHFLFNTLATVRRLQQTEAASGAAMLASFIAYLRCLIPMLQESEVRLRDEINLVNSYLSVVKMRMSGRLEVHVEIDPALECAAIPPLSVATLVENAVKHGLAPLSAGGRIRIAASTQNAKLQLSVADNGVGFKTDSAGGSGIGLYNVQARLRTLHGSAASLRVLSGQPNGVQAIMTLPFRVMPA